MNEHLDIQRLLPWYVNGTLNTTDMTQVEDHLASCAECKLSVEQELPIARGVQPKPIDLRLLQQLKAQQGTNFRSLQAKIKQSTPAPQVGLQHSKLYAGIGISFACLFLWWVMPASAPAPFEAMTSRSTADHALSVNHIIVQLAPTPHLSSAELEKIIEEIGARRLPQNNNLGVLRLQLPKRSELAADLERLRTHPELIWLGVER